VARMLVVVGTSLGGFQALKVLLSGLPEAFPAPVAIVQHQAADTEGQLSELLQRYTVVSVQDAEDKDPLLSGRVYLAPAGYHLMIEGDHCALSTEAPVWYARPSIDVLFESAAEAYGSGVIGVALTCASRDGARGLARIKACGGIAIVEDPVEAESRTLPDAAIASTAVDAILPVAQIPAVLIGYCQNAARI